MLIVEEDLMDSGGLILNLKAAMESALLALKLKHGWGIVRIR